MARRAMRMLQCPTRKVATAVEREPRPSGEVGTGQNGQGQWGSFGSVGFARSKQVTLCSTFLALKSEIMRH